MMKNVRIHPLIPTLPGLAERNPQKGETAASFTAQAIREDMEHRQEWSEFVARGIASRDEAKRTGIYVAPDAVIGRLGRMLARIKANRTRLTPQVEHAGEFTRQGRDSDRY
ncbi:prevent-host-death protein [Pseudoduganella namucuonensis]|uniref:Uncharacterized protein n=1 Tax=Pseudoduganella namucuonensis TaxID=1035707 RepID=A0A1I7L2K4_9BURK|nr:prevent-host-death protein [Pseudoduganella namucuonensis]SFV03917.1 hypothetical protein SAMN05216552_102275 [Pseudoduganella namucuonensis]